MWQVGGRSVFFGDLPANHRASRCALECCLEGFAALDGVTVSAMPPNHAPPPRSPCPALPRHGPVATPNASSQVETQKEQLYITIQLALPLVPQAGAKMLVTGGDYCVFICGRQVIELQFVIPFVEVVKTILGKCGQMCNLIFCRIMPNFEPINT